MGADINCKDRSDLLIIVYLFLFLCFFFPAEGVCEQFCMVNIKYDGTIWKVTHNKEELLSKIDNLNGVERGAVFGKKLFSRTNRGEVYTINFVDGVRSIDSHLNNNFAKYSKYQNMYIHSVDSNTVLFSYDENYITKYYEFDIANNNMNMLPIPYAGNYLSSYNGIVYFSGEKDNISYYSKLAVFNVGISGYCPTVSPDGSKIAYISRGSLSNKLIIYDISTKKNTVILSKIFDNFMDIIRWSSDGHYVAFQLESIFERPNLIMIYDVISGNEVQVLDGSKSINWFIVDCKLLEN